MRHLTGYVMPYPLISDLFKNSNSLAVVTEIIHRRLFGWRYHRFEPTVLIARSRLGVPLILSSNIRDLRRPSSQTISIFFAMSSGPRASWRISVWFMIPSAPLSIADRRDLGWQLNCDRHKWAFDI
jgi:hypothetical protein